MIANKKRMLSLVLAIATVFSIAVFSMPSNAAAKDISSDYILDADSTEPIVVKSGSNVIIDLKGYDLTVDGYAIIVEEGATATIRGESSTVNSTQGAIVNLGGTVTVESGTYNSSKWYTVKNFGDMIIEGGVFTQGENNSGNSSLIANGWYDGTNGDTVNGTKVLPPSSESTEPEAILTINGGTFTHYTTTSTIKSDDWSRTVLNGGNFTSNNGQLIQATGDVEVNGGEYKGFANLSVLYGYNQTGIGATRLQITDGDFDATYIARVDKLGNQYVNSDGKYGTLSIVGGTFSNLTSVTAPSRVDYTKTITGGTYNIDIKNDVASGYSTKNTEAGYVVYPKATNLEISDKALNIAVGESATLTATLTPQDTLDQVNWSSENTEIAEVDANGKVTAKKAGTTNIKAAINDKEVICTVTVYEVIVDVPSVPTEDVTVVTPGMSQDAAEKVKAVLENVVDTILTDGDVVGVDKDTQETVKKAVEQGKVVNTKVVANVLEQAPADANEVRNATQKLANKFNAKFTIGQYLDLGVDILVEGNKVSEITELTDKVEFTLAIPEDISNVAKAYYIIRVHETTNGVETSIILPTVNEDGTLSFSTDKFSTYALAYTTEDINGNLSDSDPDNDGVINISDIKDNNGDGNNNEVIDSTSPKTGDPSNIGLLLIAMGASGAGLVGLRRKMNNL